MYNISARLKGNKRKLTPNYIGPYEIIEVKNNGINYKICNEHDNTIITVNRKHIRPFINDFNILHESPKELILNGLKSFKSSIEQSRFDVLNICKMYDEDEIEIDGRDISNLKSTKESFDNKLECTIWTLENITPSVEPMIEK